MPFKFQPDCCCGVVTGCCPSDTLPTVLHATFTPGNTASCGSQGSASFDLTYDPALDGTSIFCGLTAEKVWTGSFGSPVTFSVVLACSGGVWYLYGTATPGGTCNPSLPCSTILGVTCSPFSASVTGHTFAAGAGCTSGDCTGDVSITE